MHIVFVPQDSHQRRGQNGLSTDFVVFSIVLLLFSLILISILGSEALMVLHLLTSFLSLLLVYFLVGCLLCFDLVCSPLLQGLRSNYVLDWQYT